MPDLTDIPFGGLAALDDYNLIPLESAIFADDCFLDYGSVIGRNGTRSALSGAVVGSGSPQHIGRFRPSAVSARVVNVIAGQVFADTDPTSETASDGVIHSLGTPFGSGDAISGAGLGTNYYLGTNGTGAMQRINSSYALESLQAIPQGATPSFSLSGQVTWTLFKNITPTVSGCVVQTNSNTGMSGMQSDWRAFTATNNGNDDPAVGAYAQYKLAAAVNALGNDWLAVAVSPHDSGGTVTTWQVEIDAAIDIAGSPGSFQKLGVIYDVPPVAGSPNLIFLDLRPLDPTVRSAIRWLQFSNAGSNGGKYIVYGYMFLPGKPVTPPPFNYYVDFFDGAYTAGNLTAPTSIASGQQSNLTGPMIVTPGAANIASYPDSYMSVNEPHNDNVMDTVLGANTNREFNQQSGAAAFPTLAEIGSVVTFTGTAPTFTMATLTARLWKDTQSGRRLVAVATVTSGGSYTLVDNGGLGVLQNQLYTAGGVGPACNALGAHAGRLVAGLAQRVYISSFIPTSDTSNPFPQWPAIPLLDSDGWSFDIYPSSRAQIQVINGEGDGTYILTQEACYIMPSLAPNSVPYLVYDRGAMGRQAACYAEDRFFWAAYDGVYEAVNTSQVAEMTKNIRRYYTDWLAPTSVVVVVYNDRKLYVIQGTRYLRFDFVKQVWTRGTLADSVSMACSWVDPGGTKQMWFLTSDRRNLRWQTSATRDGMIGTNTATGTALPDWVFSTGFSLTQIPAVVDGILVDATDVVVVTVAKTYAGNIPTEGRQFAAVPRSGQDEVWEPGSAQLRAMKFRVQFNAPNTTTLRRAMWERSLISAKGG
jgi:hypothetical protein